MYLYKNQSQSGIGVIGIVIVLLLMATASLISVLAYQRISKNDEMPGQTEEQTSISTDSMESVDSDQPSTSAGTSQPSEHQTIIDTDKYTFTLPNGWEKSSVHLFENGAGNAYRTADYSYTNPTTGEYFEVVFRQAGSGGGGVSPDYTWVVDIRDKSIQLAATPETLCSPDPSGMCPARDGRLDVFVSDPDYPSVNGYEYYFYFGNLKKEVEVSTEFAKEIFASFQFK